MIKKTALMYIVAASILALVVYAQAYILLVEQWSYSPAGWPRSTFYMFPRYTRIDTSWRPAARIVFYPAFLADTVIRHESWRPAGLREPSNEPPARSD